MRPPISGYIRSDFIHIITRVLIYLECILLLLHMVDWRRVVASAARGCVILADHVEAGARDRSDMRGVAHRRTAVARASRVVRMAHEIVCSRRGQAFQPSA